MMRHTPKLKYCGLNIVLSNPSRFDKEALLSGRAGALLNEALYPTCNRFQCDIRLKEETAPLLPNTKLLLLLGESCLQKFTNNEAQINAQRGNLNWHEGIPVIATYGAQDALDPKDLEGEHNELLKMEEEIYSEEPSETDNKRRYGKTARSNYEFWFRKDIEKIRYILEYGIPPKKEFNYIIYPDSETVIKILSNTYGRDFYFDIETDPNLNITCFAFSFGYPDVYVVPVLDHDYSKAYGNLPMVFKALCSAISRNVCVAHNGSGFDFIVLAHKYHIPVNRVYDTMLAANRIYPEVEKSLGHCISLPWMFESFHKDESGFAFGNREQAMNLWKYCGKDVSSLVLLKEAQLKYASKIPGLTSSIMAVNSYVKAYTAMTLIGLRYDQSFLDETIKANDRLCNQYLRILTVLIGKKNMEAIKRNGKGSIASSSKQAIRYFHDMLQYKIVLRSKKTKLPSLAAKAMFKLKLAHPIMPVIDCIIAYRILAKETGSLKFKPYKTNEENNIG